MPKINARLVDTPSILWMVEVPLKKSTPLGWQHYSEDAEDDRSYSDRLVPLNASVTRSRVNIHGEFDPGSGRTLAACLTHASRTMKPFGVD